MTAEERKAIRDKAFNLAHSCEVASRLTLNKFLRASLLEAADVLRPDPVIELEPPVALEGGNISLHFIYCDCERCAEARGKARA